MIVIYEAFKHLHMYVHRDFWSNMKLVFDLIQPLNSACAIHSIQQSDWEELRLPLRVIQERSAVISSLWNCTSPLWPAIVSETSSAVSNPDTATGDYHPTVTFSHTNTGHISDLSESNTTIYKPPLNILGFWVLEVMCVHRCRY